jgi:isoamyl acetate esterase
MLSGFILSYFTLKNVRNEQLLKFPNAGEPYAPFCRNFSSFFVFITILLYCCVAIGDIATQRINNLQTMTIIRNTLFILFFFIGMAAAPPSVKPLKIVFFGDSITQAGVNPGGFIDKMKAMLETKGIKENYQLIGAGIGGNKIYDLYLRFEEDVLVHNPDVVLIWVGVNDVWHKATYGTGTDADKFEKFYTALVKKFQSKGIKVVLATPATIGERIDFSNQQDGDLNFYSQIIRNIAAKFDCPVADFRKEFLKYNVLKNTGNKESGILTSDRVHLNDAGNQLVADILTTLLIK